MKIKVKGQSVGIGKNILYGCLISVAVTIIMLCAAAYLEDTEIIEGNIFEIIVIAIQFLSAAVGCVVAAQGMETDFLVSSLITALGYFLIMSIISLTLFDGSFISVFQGALALASGAAVAIWVVWSGKKRRNSQRRNFYSR